MVLEPKPLITVLKQIMLQTLLGCNVCIVDAFSRWRCRCIVEKIESVDHLLSMSVFAETFLTKCDVFWLPQLVRDASGNEAPAIALPGDLNTVKNISRNRPQKRSCGTVNELHLLMPSPLAASLSVSGVQLFALHSPDPHIMTEEKGDVQEIESDGFLLDLTNSHLPSLLSVPLPATLTSLDLTANRLTSFEPPLLALPGGALRERGARAVAHCMRRNTPRLKAEFAGCAIGGPSPRMTIRVQLHAALRSLSLRQNLIEDASDVGRLASAPLLTELVLQDNRLSSVPDLGALAALQRLELSYNEIKSLAPLTSLRSATLSALYAASNRISLVRRHIACTASTCRTASMIAHTINSAIACIALLLITVSKCWCWQGFVLASLKVCCTVGTGGRHPAPDPADAAGAGLQPPAQRRVGGWPAAAARAVAWPQPHHGHRAPLQVCKQRGACVPAPASSVPPPPPPGPRAVEKVSARVPGCPCQGSGWSYRNDTLAGAG